MVPGALEAPGSAVVDEAMALDAALPDRDWTVLPPGAVRSDFAAPSGPLAMVSLGDPSHPRIVLVPGVTGSKEDFTLMLPTLAEAGFYVQSYDLAGQYESFAAGPENLVPPRPDYDYDLFVDDLIAVLEAGSGPVHVLGYSFAGVVAQLGYLRRPELYASLALLSCPPEPGQAFRGVSRVGRFSGLTSPRIAAALMVWGLHRNVTHVPPGRQAFVEHRFALTRMPAVDAIFGLMMRAPDARSAIAAADIPKLVAVGEHDLWPLHLHAAFAEQIGARIAVYRTGHSPCETTPHQFSRDLLQLYRRESA